MNLPLPVDHKQSVAQLRLLFVAAMEAQERAAELTTQSVIESEKRWPGISARGPECDALVAVQAAGVRLKRIIESLDRYTEMLVYQDELVGLRRAP